MPPSILIVGLGPGSADQLTREAWRVLESAAAVYLRTRQHPSVAGLPTATLHSFDAEYEVCPTLAEVYERIAQQVVALGERPEGVIYAVPGHPLVGDTLYGGPALPGFPRQFLHASAVVLEHPRTGAPLRIEAPLTEDLRAFLEPWEGTQ